MSSWQNKIKMEKELKKYKSTNSFLFTTDLNLEEVCNAPDGVSGVFFKSKKWWII